MAVSRTISPHDRLYNETAAAGYFRIGEQCVELIEGVRNALPSSYDKPSFRRILDLPCGHGRELRYLRDAYPDSEIVACDLLPDAVDFCASEFDVTPVHSPGEPEGIRLQGEFDLIWCGSLLTHLDAPMWPRFLSLFASVLAHNGLLFFTTQGRRAAAIIASGQKDFFLGADAAQAVVHDFEDTGFGYRNYPNRDDYGFSIAAPSWTIKLLIEPRLDLRLVTYMEMGWAAFQDVVSCVKRPIEGVRVGADLAEL